MTFNILAIVSFIELLRLNSFKLISRSFIEMLDLDSFKLISIISIYMEKKLSNVELILLLNDVIVDQCVSSITIQDN